MFALISVSIFYLILKPQKILPIFNRVVIFNTNDISFHGNPTKVKCPSSMSRKSIALYYFSNGRPKEEIRPILFQKSTFFKQRPGEKFKFNIRYILLNLSKELMPPILYRVAKKVYGYFY